MKKKKRKKIARKCDQIFDVVERMGNRQSHCGFCGDVEAEGDMEEIALLLMEIRRSMKT